MHDLHPLPSAPAALERLQQAPKEDASLFSSTTRTLSGSYMGPPGFHQQQPGSTYASPANTVSSGSLGGGSPPDWSQNPTSPFGMLPAAAIHAPEWVPSAHAQQQQQPASAPWVHGDHPFLAVRA
jgi:hypothetical protein